MDKKDVIKIAFILVFLLWLAVAMMPRRLAIVQDLNEHYYDKAMALQEFNIRKEQEKIAKDKTISLEATLDSIESLAQNHWASFKSEDALRLLTVIKEKREKLDKHYNQKLIHTMLLLAGVHRDLNQLDKTLTIYKQVWDLDKKNLAADDIRLIRDQSNLAMVYYLKGDSESDETKRQRNFKTSVAYISQAKELWRDKWSNQTNADLASLANLDYLQYLNYRELGDKQTAQQAYFGMKQLRKKLGYTYNPPWT